ncbi:MAG: hypothetical protein Q7U99_06170 [Rubrivivax sp.]|nr:hypothetical protein [Rubrivivax sp.]
MPALLQRPRCIRSFVLDCKGRHNTALIAVLLAIYLTFVISGLLFAASDWISDSRKSL